MFNHGPDDCPGSYTAWSCLSGSDLIQTLPGLNGNGMRGHSVGAAQILLGRGYTGPKDDFETKLLLSLRGPVVRTCRSIHKPLIDLMFRPSKVCSTARSL